MDAQEPVRLSVDGALGPDDRLRPLPVLPLDLLDPQVPDHQVPTTCPPYRLRNMTDVPVPVGKREA
jgi:hypothetical protein